MDYKEKILKLEKINSNNKLEKAKLEERLKTLEEEQTKLEKELNEEGFLVEELAEDIKKLEEKLDEGIEQCKKILEN